MSTKKLFMLALAVALWSGACVAPPAPVAPEAPASAPPAATPSPQPTVPPAFTAEAVTPAAIIQGEKPTMEPTSAIPPELMNAPQLKMAKDDLAQRLGVSPEEIEVIAVEMVVWPNKGMGCPTPGMEYPQVPVDGLRIVLGHEGQTYEYHSGGTRPPFLCPNP